MKGLKGFISEAEKVVRTYDMAQAVKLHAEGTVIFIDVRDEKEVELYGKIPNALVASRGMLEFYIDPTSPFHKDFFTLDREFVFYCGSGGRSVLAVHRAMEMGLKNVAQVGGGFKAWEKAGNSIEKITKS